MVIQSQNSAFTVYNMQSATVQQQIPSVVFPQMGYQQCQNQYVPFPPMVYTQQQINDGFHYMFVNQSITGMQLHINELKAQCQLHDKRLKEVTQAAVQSCDILKHKMLCQQNYINILKNEVKQLKEKTVRLVKEEYGESEDTNEKENSEKSSSDNSS